MNRPLLAGIALISVIAAFVFWPRRAENNADASAPGTADPSGRSVVAESLEGVLPGGDAVQAEDPPRAALEASAVPVADLGNHPTWIFSDGRPFLPETWFYVVDGQPTVPGGGPPKKEGARIEVAAVDEEGYPWVGETGPGPFTAPIVIDDYIDVRANIERAPGAVAKKDDAFAVAVVSATRAVIPRLSTLIVRGDFERPARRNEAAFEPSASAVGVCARLLRALWLPEWRGLVLPIAGVHAGFGLNLFWGRTVFPNLIKATRKALKSSASAKQRVD